MGKPGEEQNEHDLSHFFSLRTMRTMKLKTTDQETILDASL